MTDSLKSIEIGLRLQGPRPPVGNQAGVEKLATGTPPSKKPGVCSVKIHCNTTQKQKTNLVKKTGKKQTCFYFQKGSCKYGIKCRYLHTSEDSTKNPVKQSGIRWRWMICPYFLKGSCKFGIICRNPHSRGDCMIKMNQTRSVNKTNGDSNKPECKSHTGFITVTRNKKSTATSNSTKVRPTYTNQKLNTSNTFEHLINLDAREDETSDISNNFDMSVFNDPPAKMVMQHCKVKNMKSSERISKDSKRHSAKSSKNQNPTGDIWEQSSLNLDTLFEIKTQSKFRIGIWNAESVRHKENQVKKYILDNDLDIFIILESWLYLDELPSTIDILPSIEGYKLHQLPRPDRKNSSGGGMLCIYKHNIDITKIPAMNTKLLEVMDLQLVAKNKTIRIVSVYRPPRSESRRYPITDFYDDMENLVSFYKTVKDDVIFCGDYNVHVNKPDESETRRFINITESANLKQHISEKTHLKGNTLDLVLSENGSKLINRCEVSDFMSDHAVILVDLNLSKPPKSKKTIRFRKNKEVDLKKLESQIETNLQGIGEVDNIADLVDKFNQALGNAYNEQAPLKSKNVIMRPPTPWSYDDIKEDKAIRRKLERKWRQTGLQVDWEIYRDFRNKFNAKLNNFRNKQYAEMIEQNKDNPATLFKVINQSLHRKETSPLPAGLTNQELSEKFSCFFSEKIDKIRANIDAQDADQTDNDSNEQLNDLPKLSEFKTLSEHEVKKLIMDFPNKQCGLDPLPISMLKECLPVLLTPITRIVNLSLSLGDLPISLKKAIIRPLLKKMGLEPELKNYRPVSNLSFLSKLIEKIVAIQFVDHLTKNGLFDPFQSAYKKFHSTETALLKVQNDILIDIDNKNVAIIVLLDLSAAFDTIDHKILLKRLRENYGIEDNALKWFKSYLRDRSQTVIVDDVESEPKQLKYGVPQGSVLGPLLFTAYMAPLKHVITKYGLRYHCYADDTQLYISFSPMSGDQEELAIDSLESAIKDIKSFMVANKLKLNDDKTEVIFLGTQHRLQDIHSTGIKIGDISISPSEKVRNLGVIFDKNLSMDEQVKSICKSGFYHVKNLWRISKFLNDEQTNIAAHAFITSKLDYGNALLGGVPKYLVKKLQSVQNAAARVVTKTGKYDHISDKLRDLKWLPVKYRILYKLNLLTWKVLNGQSPDYLSEMISERDVDIDLRSGNTKVLNVPKTKLKTMGDRAFSVIAPKTWNQLPKELRLNDRLQSFKAGLKSHYSSEAYGSLD